MYIDLFCFINWLWTEGKPIPTELRNEEAALRQEIDHEDQNTAGNFSINLSLFILLFL